ncbi:Lissencephaly-1, partial [Coemansia aciculifera]
MADNQSQILPERQLKELEKSILDFMHTHGYTESATVFARESSNEGFIAGPTDRHHNLLAKKWTSVIRLQRKIIELESKLSKQAAELPISKANSLAAGEWLPRPPARTKLTQHRSPITRVRFHPQYTQLATASEDMTVKLWDSESGDFERTVKGHTNTVLDVAFDSKGAIMVTCSADLTLRVWDTTADYKCIRTLHGHDHCVSAVCFLGSDRLA